MQKTIAIAGSLLLGIFIGVFSVSALNKRVRQKPVAAVTTQEPPTIVNANTSKNPDMPLFYTSVGGSAPSNDTPSSASKVSTRYTIELATVNSQADAESMLIRLKDRGVDGFYTPMRRGSEVLFHVRIGLFANADEAEQSRKKIATRTNLSGRVTRLH
jgi:cell division septation protein DedD